MRIKQDFFGTMFFMEWSLGLEPWSEVLEWILGVKCWSVRETFIHVVKLVSFGWTP